MTTTVPRTARCRSRSAGDSGREYGLAPPPDGVSRGPYWAALVHARPPASRAADRSAATERSRIAARHRGPDDAHPRSRDIHQELTTTCAAGSFTSEECLDEARGAAPRRWRGYWAWPRGGRASLTQAPPNPTVAVLPDAGRLHEGTKGPAACTPGVLVGGCARNPTIHPRGVPCVPAMPGAIATVTERPEGCTRPQRRPVSKSSGLRGGTALARPCSHACTRGRWLRVRLAGCLPPDDNPG
jgi:hypothetical protein